MITGKVSPSHLGTKLFGPLGASATVRVFIQGAEAAFSDSQEAYPVSGDVNPAVYHLVTPAYGVYDVPSWRMAQGEELWATVPAAAEGNVYVSWLVTYEE